MGRKKKAAPGKAAESAGKYPESAESASTAFVTVDYPQDGEIVTSSQYAMRVSTSASEGVEISIDGKAWQPCRESAGFWWYDWSGYGAGPHAVLARITVGKRASKSKARSFTVLI